MGMKSLSLIRVDHKAVAMAGVVVVALYWLSKRETASLAQAVKPWDQENVFNQGFNEAWASVTDGQGTFGTDLYEFFNPTADQLK